YRNGKGFSESAHTKSKTEAQDQLKKRIAEITNGQFVSPQHRRIKVDEIFQLLLDYYEINGRASLKKAKQRWEKRLKPFFGGYKASQVGTEMLTRFVLKCQQDELSNGTINRDL